MSVSRRDFLGAGAAAAAGLALPQARRRDAGHHGPRPGRAHRRKAFAGRPVIISAANGSDSDDNGKRGHPGRLRHAGRREPIRSTRSSPACTIVELDPNGSIGRTRRACRTRRASCSSTRAACTADETRGCGRRARGHRDAGARGEGGDGLHRPHHARRRRREEIRARDGLQGAEPAHREEPRRTGCAGRRGSTRATTGSIRSTTRRVASSAPPAPVARRR